MGNNPNSISQGQLQALRTKHDKNKDGKFTFAEIKPLASEICRLEGANQVSDETLSKWFKQADKDNSGQVSWNEFEAFYAKMKKQLAAKAGGKAPPPKAKQPGQQQQQKAGQPQKAKQPGPGTPKGKAPPPGGATTAQQQEAAATSIQAAFRGKKAREELKQGQTGAKAAPPPPKSLQKSKTGNFSKAKTPTSGPPPKGKDGTSGPPPKSLQKSKTGSVSPRTAQKAKQPASGPPPKVKQPGPGTPRGKAPPPGGATTAQQQEAAATSIQAAFRGKKAREELKQGQTGAKAKPPPPKSLQKSKTGSVSPRTAQKAKQPTPAKAKSKAPSQPPQGKAAAATSIQAAFRGKKTRDALPGTAKSAGLRKAPTSSRDKKRVPPTDKKPRVPWPPPIGVPWAEHVQEAAGKKNNVALLAAKTGVLGDLSDPESDKSADSISGEVVRKWDTSIRDRRYMYMRDKAVSFSQDSRPLEWSHAEWSQRLGWDMQHLHKEALDRRVLAVRSTEGQVDLIDEPPERLGDKPESDVDDDEEVPVHVQEKVVRSIQSQLAKEPSLVPPQLPEPAPYLFELRDCLGEIAAQRPLVQPPPGNYPGPAQQGRGVAGRPDRRPIAAQYATQGQPVQRTQPSPVPISPGPGPAPLWWPTGVPVPPDAGSALAQSSADAPGQALWAHEALWAREEPSSSSFYARPPAAPGGVKRYWL